MNLPRYEFSKESESSLINFLKVARQQKSLNRNCDLEKYEIWNKLLPLDSELAKKLDEDDNTNTPPEVINLCSDEEVEVHPSTSVVQEVEVLEAEEESTISDIASSIRDNVDMENDLPVNVRQYFAKCSSMELEQLFKMLEGLSTERIYCLGLSLQSNATNELLALFCRYLLIPLIKREYCNKILSLLQHFCLKYSTVITEECLSITGGSVEEINVFLQYTKKLDTDFQATLVRDIILSLDRLNSGYVILIDNLLNDQVEYVALNKLVELLSNIAEDHKTDKTFGKLLMHTIEVLGPNLIHVEEPLKHIIAGHKSVWKSKLEKIFTVCYEDSMLFSQSFRD